MDISEIEDELYVASRMLSTINDFREEDLMNLIGMIFDKIEEEAENNMMKTGKLEGMHYAALKEMRKKLDIPRKFKNEIK